MNSVKRIAITAFVLGLVVGFPLVALFKWAGINYPMRMVLCGLIGICIGTELSKRDRHRRRKAFEKSLMDHDESIDEAIRKAEEVLAADPPPAIAETTRQMIEALRRLKDEDTP